MDAVSYGVYNMTVPSKGPMAVSFPLDFTSENTATFDLTAEMLNRSIDYIQGLYIDNWKGAVGIDLLVGISRQTLHVPAHAQIYLPVLASNPFVVQAYTANGAAAGVVPCFGYNVPIAPFCLINPNP